MSRSHRKSRPGKRVARRDTSAYRNRYVALAAHVALPGHVGAGTGTPAPVPAPVGPRYLHEEELTGQAREDVTEALREFLTDQFTGEVPYTNDIEVAWHNGYLLSAAWLLFSATEAYDVWEAFERHQVAPHPDWWITDGWGEFHDKWGVKCPDCEAYNYAHPHWVSDKPADADWPGTCCSCGHAMPVQHYTDVFGSDSTWWAGCSCGWDPDRSYKTEPAAKGAVTRHLKTVQAATSD